AGMVDAERQVAQALREPERDRRLRRQLARDLERAVENRIGYRVDEADAQRLLRVDRAPAEDELLRGAEPADPRQPLRTAPARDDAEVDLRLTELRARRRVADVAGECELAAAAEREAVDGRDRR